MFQTKQNNVSETYSKKRPRNVPQRYGNRAELDGSESEKENSFLNGLMDNSFDDITYVPEKRPKVIATITRNNSDKRPQICNQLTKVNVDQMFDEINLGEQIHSQNYDAPIDVEFTQMQNSECINASINNNRRTSKLNDDFFVTLSGKMDELLARMAVLEEKFIQNCIQLHGKKGMDQPSSSSCQENSEIKLFFLSNGLPLKNVADMARFEKNLTHPDFEKKTVRLCCY